MRFLVTGAAGLLGSRVCEQLLRLGDDMVAFDVAPPTTLRNRLGSETADRIYVRGDITDPFTLLRTARDREVEGIVHIASMLGAGSSANPSLAVRVNSGGFVNVLETARFLGIRRVAWASTTGVFGGYTHDTPVANDAPYKPARIYAGTKVLNEVLAQEYSDKHGLETIGIRYTLLVGTEPNGGLNSTVWNELIQKPVRGLPARIPHGDDRPAWLWIDDAARALVLAARGKNTRARAFNVSGDIRPWRDAVEIVRRLIPGADITLEPGSAGHNRMMETSAIEQELGFFFEWRLEAQIEEMIRVARAQQEGA